MPEGRVYERGYLWQLLDTRTGEASYECRSLHDRQETACHNPLLVFVDNPTARKV